MCQRVRHKIPGGRITGELRVRIGNGKRGANPYAYDDGDANGSASADFSVDRLIHLQSTYERKYLHNLLENGGMSI